MSWEGVGLDGFDDHKDRNQIMMNIQNKYKP